MKGVRAGHGGRGNSMGACCQGDPRRPGVHLHPGSVIILVTAGRLRVPAGHLMASLQREGKR